MKIDNNSTTIDPTSIIPDRFDIFLSYSSKNDNAASSLYKGLTERGVKVWYDKKEMSMGDTKTATIEKGLQRSKFFLILLTKDSITSDWVKWETKIATALEQQERIKIIPYNFGLSTKEILDFSPTVASSYWVTSEVDEKINIERIVKAVQKN